MSEQGSHPVMDTGGVGPQGVADRSGAPEGGQAPSSVRPARLGAPAWLGIAALAGWSLVCVGGGGIDPGDGLGGPGPRAAFLALALGAPLAFAAVVLAWDRAALRSGPARLAMAALGGVAAWAALSILWAAAPDLAWIDANRQAIALCALALGLALGALVPDAPRWLGLGLAVGAAPPVLLALGSKVLPGWLGADGDLARLAAPLGYWNALALVAVFAVPGLLWLAGAHPPRRWTLPVAAGGLTVAVLTVLLTYSRGGVISLVAAVAVTVAFLPARWRAFGALAVGAVCALPAAAHGLSDPLLSSDQVPTGLRESAGLGLGWRLVLGVAAAAVLAPMLVRLLDGRVTARDGRRAVAIALAAVALAAAGTLAASSSARGWVADRGAEFRGEGGDAVANDPGRLVSTSGNQRRAWWGEAWRGFEARPLIGQGAGGFPLVHLRERRVADNSLNTREAHGIVPGVLSGLGVVGAALLAALLGAVVWGVLRAADVRPDPDLGLPLAVLAAFVLQAAVDWSWSIPALTIPTLAAAGVVLAAAAPGPAPGARSRPGPLAAGALGAAVAVAVISATLPWWSSGRTAAGEDALADGRPQAAIDLARQAHAADPLTVTPLLLMAQAYDDLREPRRALGAYEEATRLQPDNPATWRALAIFLGRGAAAGAAWREVHRLDPQDPEAALRAR